MRDIVQTVLYKTPLIVPVFLGLVGCAGAPETRGERADLDPIFTVETVAPLPARAPDGAPPSVRDATAFRVETFIVRPSGETIAAPALTVRPRQRADIVVMNQTAYVETFGVEVVEGAFIADPVVGILRDGVVVDLCVAAEGDAAVLAYRAVVSVLAKPIPLRSFELVEGGDAVTIQMPAMQSSEVSGVRRIVPGVLTRLATLGTDAEPVDLLVRVTPADVVLPDFVDRASETFLGTEPTAIPDFAAPGGEDLPLAQWLAARGADLRIDVEAVLLDDWSATPDPGAAPGEVLRRLSLTSRATPGAGVRVSLDEAYLQDMNTVTAGATSALEPLIGTLRTGVRAEVTAAGRLDITWSTSPRWDVHAVTVGEIDVTVDVPVVQRHECSIALQPGRWLFPLGTTAAGRALALRVTVTPVTASRPRFVSTRSSAASTHTNLGRGGRAAHEGREPHGESLAAAHRTSGSSWTESCGSHGSSSPGATPTRSAR